MILDHAKEKPHTQGNEHHKEKRDIMALLRGAYGGGQIKGSISGTTYQQSPYGTIARNRTVPVNPNTARQVGARNAFSGAVALWTLSSDAARAAWNAYAQATPILNSFGDTIIVQGRAMFMRTNQWLINQGLAPILDAPVTPGLPFPGIGPSVGADISAGGVTLAGFITPPPADGFIQLQASGNVGEQVIFFKGPWKYTASDVSPATLPVTIIPGADIVIGQFYFVRYSFMDEFGRLANPIIIKTLAATA